MTDRDPGGHSKDMTPANAVALVPGSLPERAASRAIEVPSFDAVYESHFDFVWRSMQRLGVPGASLDDAVQDVFLVVHRRLSEFEGRSSVKTWIFGIAMRVARDHRRTLRRKGGLDALEDDAVADASPSPMDTAERSEALTALNAVLEALDENKRAVFILAELEQMSAPEIADALGINSNTVYSRLRAARAEFEESVARYRRRQR